MRMKLHTAASLASLIVMSCCGLWVSWQLKDQIYHANPHAVYIACAASSIFASVYGLALVKIYIKTANIGLFLFPISLLILTALSASVVYCGILLFLSSQKHVGSLNDVFSAVHSYAIFYLELSAPVWLVGLTTASIMLRKLARRSMTV